MTSEPGPGPAVVRLRTALQATADALVSARLDALLSSEAELAAAVSSLTPVTPHPPLDPETKARLSVELRETWRALRRCQRLGAGLNDFVRASLAAQGRIGAYDRSGQDAPPATRNAELNARG